MLKSTETLFQIQLAFTMIVTSIGIEFAFVPLLTTLYPHLIFALC